MYLALLKINFRAVVPSKLNTGVSDLLNGSPLCEAPYNLVKLGFLAGRKFLVLQNNFVVGKQVAS